MALWPPMLSGAPGNPEAWPRPLPGAWTPLSWLGVGLPFLGGGGEVLFSSDGNVCLSSPQPDSLGW